MSKAVIKEIKEYVDKEEYDKALTLCDKLLTSSKLDDQESFFVHSFQGQCFIQLGRIEHGENALLEATKLSAAAPTVQLQKIWKLLADLYEKIGRWDSFARATIKLYDMILEKGNIERAQVLATLIASAFAKSDKLDGLQGGCEFIEAVLKKQPPLTTNQDVYVQLIGHLGLILESVDECKAKANSKSISSVVQSDLEEPWRSPQAAYDHLVAIVPGYNILPISDIGVVSLVKRFLKAKRKLLHIDEQLTWSEMAAISKGAVAVVNSTDVFKYYVETYFFIYEDFSDLRTRSEAALEVDPDFCHAHAALAFMHLNAGQVATAYKHVKYCQSVWKGKSKEEKNIMEKNSIEDVLSSLCIIVCVISKALGEFTELPICDTLHYIEEACRRCKSISERFGSLRHRIMNIIYLCRLIGYCSVGQIKLATENMAELLHSSDDGNFPVSTCKQSGNIAFVLNFHYDFSHDSILICWLTIILLRRVELFDNAISLCDRIQSLESKAFPTSFVNCEKIWCELLKEVKTVSRTKELEMILSPQRDHLFLDITLESSKCNLFLSRFQEITQNADEITAQIDINIKFKTCVVMWLAGGALRSDKTACFTSLLNCAKGNPNLGVVYTFLGHYYSTVEADKDRAEKCYLKALTIYPLDAEAGYALSRIYLAAKDEKKAESLWRNIDSASCDHALWSLVIKAHFLIAHNTLDSAVSTFQRALEIDPDSSSCWFGLGCAYSMLRQNTSAIRSLQKALILLPESLLIKNMIGEVNRRLCLFYEAEKSFTSVLFASVNDVSALKGMGDVSLALAYTALVYGWTGGAYRNLMQGIACVERAIAASEEKKCLQKLLGDLCCFTHSLSPCDSRIDKNKIPSYDDMILVIKKGQGAYKKLVAMDSTAQNLYDLGCSLYFEAVSLLFARGQGSGLLPTRYLIDSKVRLILQNAMDIFARGIKLEPLNSNCWNGLGLCTLHEPVKVYCFSRATQLDGNASAFSNLAVNHIFNSRFASARICFSEIQAKDANPNIWVGLGSIFEMTSNSLNNVMANDAYEAAVEVAKPAESLISSAVSALRLLGYNSSLQRIHSDNECTMCRLIYIKHAVEVRTEAYVYRRPIHPFAWNLLGWAREQRGSYSSAAKAYSAGVDALNVIRSYTQSAEFAELRLSPQDKEMTEAIEKIEIYSKSFSESLARCTGKVDEYLFGNESNPCDIIPSYEEIRNTILAELAGLKLQVESMAGNLLATDSVLTCKGCSLMRSLRFLDLFEQAKALSSEQFAIDSCSPQTEEQQEKKEPVEAPYLKRSTLLKLMFMDPLQAPRWMKLLPKV